MAENTIQTTEEPTSEQIPSTRAEERFLAPAVDIFEIKEGLAVVADLPGANREDVDVRVDNRTLTISATSRHHLQEEPIQREFQLGRYFRQFQLGEDIDQEKIRAEHRDGVLRLVLPTAERARPRRIEVTAD